MKNDFVSLLSMGQIRDRREKGAFGVFNKLGFLERKASFLIGLGGWCVKVECYGS